MLSTNTRDVVGFIRDLALDRNGARTDALTRKSAVPAATTAASSYSSLVELAGISEFRAALERKILPAVIDGAWKIPFAIPFSLQSGPATATWIDEGAPIRVSGFVSAAVRLPPRKIATISVLTGELLRATGSKADATIIRILTNALAAAVNSTFVSSVAASGGAPGGIAENAASISSTGDTAAEISSDLSALISLADSADVDLAQSSWLMSPAKAALIAAALGLPNLGLRGGFLLGAPALVDRAIGSDVLLVDGSRVAVALGNPDVMPAESATLEMLDNPTNASSDGTATNMVSLFQTDSIALRATLAVNWAAAADSVFALTGTAPS